MFYIAVLATPLAMVILLEVLTWKRKKAFRNK